MVPSGSSIGMSNAKFFRLDNQGEWPVHAVETGARAHELLNDAAAGGIVTAVQGYALATAMFTFSESKLLDDLEAAGSLQPRESAERHGYDAHQTLGLLRFLVTQGLFAE